MTKANQTTQKLIPVGISEKNCWWTLYAIKQGSGGGGKLQCTRKLLINKNYSHSWFSMPYLSLVTHIHDLWRRFCKILQKCLNYKFSSVPIRHPMQLIVGDIFCHYADLATNNICLLADSGHVLTFVIFNNSPNLSELLNAPIRINCERLKHWQQRRFSWPKCCAAA